MLLHIKQHLSAPIVSSAGEWCESKVNSFRLTQLSAYKSRAPTVYIFENIFEYFHIPKELKPLLQSSGLWTVAWQ